MLLSRRVRRCTGLPKNVRKSTAVHFLLIFWKAHHEDHFLNILTTYCQQLFCDCRSSARLEFAWIGKIIYKSYLNIFFLSIEVIELCSDLRLSLGFHSSVKQLNLSMLCFTGDANKLQLLQLDTVPRALKLLASETHAIHRNACLILGTMSKHCK
jgi:hypothetical protein